MRPTCVLLPWIAVCVLAQTNNTSSQPTAASDTFRWKRLNFSGYLDAFYDLKYNHPASGSSQLQAFNLTADKWSLGNATAVVALDPAPFGFRVDAGAGRTYDAFWLSEPSHTDWTRHLLNAYVSLKPATWQGLQFDFGKFVTSAGAEVTESHLNWNYSRSLLFAFGPYYHTGLRASMPLNPKWSVGGALVAGWNTIRDNNSGKSFGVTAAGNLGRVQIANTYYAGPERTGTNEGWRHFYDAVVTFTPARRVSMYANFDVGSQRSPASPAATFWGVAWAARIQLSPNFAISPRVEHYSDRNGFWTGSPNWFREYTLTAESRLNDCLISRLEIRKDWSREPFFEMGPGGGLRRHQLMLVTGVMVVVKPGLFALAVRNGK
ncbi:MAG: outer membrane beta-barrel protein [Bryobacteraceae bacterium]